MNASTDVQEKWDTYRQTSQAMMPLSDWQAGVDRAKELFGAASLADQQVEIVAEVQLMLNAQIRVRTWMHDL